VDLQAVENVFEATDERAQQLKQQSLCLISGHFESVLSIAAATQIVLLQTHTKKSSADNRYY
jgi:hypothetical protein